MPDNDKNTTLENNTIPSGVQENNYELNGPIDFNNNILSDSCLNTIPEYNTKPMCDNMFKFDGYEKNNYMAY
jgi:hypothetical protein